MGCVDGVWMCSGVCGCAVDVEWMWSAVCRCMWMCGWWMCSGCAVECGCGVGCVGACGCAMECVEWGVECGCVGVWVKDAELALLYFCFQVVKCSQSKQQT